MAQSIHCRPPKEEGSGKDCRHSCCQDCIHYVFLSKHDSNIILGERQRGRDSGPIPKVLPWQLSPWQFNYALYSLGLPGWHRQLITVFTLGPVIQLVLVVWPRLSWSWFRPVPLPLRSLTGALWQQREGQHGPPVREGRALGNLAPMTVLIMHFIH